MKISHASHEVISFSSFRAEVYAVGFFKVMQQQTIGEVAKSDNVCVQR